MQIIQALLILFLPALALLLAHRVKVIDVVGPVVLCYLMGILMGNLPWTVHEGVVKPFTELTIVLALPLLLFSADIKGWLKLAPRTILSFALMMVAAVTSALGTYFLLGAQVKDSWKIAGMLVGMYTGGTPNTSAIGKLLGVSNETFVLVNTADLICGGFWLLFVLGAGQRVCLLFLPPFQGDKNNPHDSLTEAPDEAPATALEARLTALPKLAQMGLAIIGCLVVVGASVGISFALYNKIQATAVILSLTTLGLLASLWRPLRKLAWSYEAGDYLLLMFCTAIGALVDIQRLTQSTAILTFLGFAACLMGGAIVIHMILAAIFRIDADTTLITSSAGIFGPPFIGPIASALKNRALLVSGLTMSIAGLAIGTYLGYLLAILLKP